MMMRSFTLKDWFEQPTVGPPILILDGGVSTHLEHVLQARNNETFSHRSLWSSSLLLTDEGKQDIVATHITFYEHGADLASTVTYQCNFGTQSTPCPVESDAVMVQMIQDGVNLAQDAASRFPNKNVYVVASIGCYGAALADGSEYSGNYGNKITKEQLKHFYRRKVRILAHATLTPPDAIAFETVPSAVEVDAIMELLQEQLLNIPCWISLACQDDSHLNDGTDVTLVMDRIQQLDTDCKLLAAIGFNCCDSQYIPGLLAKIIPRISNPRAIVVYPNSGEEWDAALCEWKRGTGCTNPNDFAHAMMDAIAMVQGPKLIVGGCCRTSPATIAALRKCVDEFFNRNH
jgi:homocysteine S-methyltransferase